MLVSNWRQFRSIICNKNSIKSCTMWLGFSVKSLLYYSDVVGLKFLICWSGPFLIYNLQELQRPTRNCRISKKYFFFSEKMIYISIILPPLRTVVPSANVVAVQYLGKPLLLMKFFDLFPCSTSFCGGMPSSSIMHAIWSASSSPGSRGNPGNMAKKRCWRTLQSQPICNCLTSKCSGNFNKRVKWSE